MAFRTPFPGSKSNTPTEVGTFRTPFPGKPIVKYEPSPIKPSIGEVLKPKNLFEAAKKVAGTIMGAHTETNIGKLKFGASQVEPFTVPSTGNFWKDAVNVVPALVLGATKVAVNPLLTVAETMKPIDRETGFSGGVPLVGGVKSEFSGAQADYNKMIQSGASNKQAFFYTAFRTGVDVGILVGIARGYAGRVLAKTNPKVLLQTKPISREILVKILNGEEGIDADLLKAFKKLPVEQRVQVAKRLLTDIKVAKPSVIGQVFKISDAEAQTIFDQLAKGKVPETIAPKLITTPEKPTEVAPQAKITPQKPVLPEKGIIAQELEPLAKEARKYQISGTNDVISIKTEGGSMRASNIVEHPKTGEKFLNIGNVKVDEALREEGIATKLYNEMILEAQRRGFKGIVSDLSRIEGKKSVIAKLHNKFSPERISAEVDIGAKKRPAVFLTQATKEAPVVQAVKGVEPEKLAPTKGIAELPAKPSGIAKSIEAKAIEAKLTKGFEDVAGYDPITIKDQAQRATNLINRDIELAKKMIRGEVPVEVGTKPEALLVAMEEHALKTKDAGLLQELANSPLSSETSAHAQALRILAERDPDSVAVKLREIRKAKENAITKRGKSIEKAKTDIAKEVKARTKPITKQTWADFIKSIEC